MAKPLADRIYDRVRPLPGNLVKPLEKFQNGSDNSKNGELAVTTYRHSQIGHALIFPLIAMALARRVFSSRALRVKRWVWLIAILVLITAGVFYKLTIIDR